MGSATDVLWVGYDLASPSMTAEQELELNLAAYRQSASFERERQVDRKAVAKRRAANKRARRQRKKRG